MWFIKNKAAINFMLSNMIEDSVAILKKHNRKPGLLRLIPTVLIRKTRVFQNIFLKGFFLMFRILLTFILLWQNRNRQLE